MSREYDDRYKPITVDYYDFITRGMSSYRSTSNSYWSEIERKRTETIATALTTNKEDASKLVTKFMEKARVAHDLREQSDLIVGVVKHDYVTILSKENSHPSGKELNSLSVDAKLSVLLLRLNQTKRVIDRHIAHALESSSSSSITFSQRTQDITALSGDCDALIARMSQIALLSIEQKIGSKDYKVFDELVHKVQYSNLSLHAHEWSYSIAPFDDNSDFQVSLLTIELLCFGMYAHVYAQYFGAQLYSQMTQYLYSAKRFDEYDDYVSYACKGILDDFGFNNFYAMQKILLQLRNLQHIQLQHKDVEQFALENFANLAEHQERLQTYHLRNLVAFTFMPYAPGKIEEVDFATSNTSTGTTPWIEGSNVSYAVQFVEKRVDDSAAHELMSRLSSWTASFSLSQHKKANPFVNNVENEPSVPTYVNARLVLRRFNGDVKTVKAVALLKHDESFRDIDRDLYDAAALGDLPLVQYYLKYGAYMNTVFEHRQMTLHAVARNVTTDHLKVALELLKNVAAHVHVDTYLLIDVQSVTVDAQDDHGRTPIYFAVESGNIELVRILLEHNANASIASNRRNHQMAPLHAAAYAGHANIVEVLLKKFEDLNVRTVEGFTALHFAVAFNREPVVALLLADNRTEVDAKSYIRCACATLFPPKIALILATSSGITPLHIAHAIGSEKLVKLLLGKGADIRMRTTDGSTVMHFAALSNADALIPEKCSALNNIPNVYDLTPLFIAFVHKNFKFSSKLIRNCADMNIRLTCERTMLHLAVQCADANVVEILLDNGGSVDVQDSKGMTPLEYAVALGNTTLVELLLDRRANPNALDSYGDPLIQSAFLSNYENASKILKLFIKYNMSIDNAGDSRHKNTLLHLSSAFNCASSVRILLNSTLPVDALNAQNETPLHVALRMGCVECANVLIDQGNASVTLQGGVANWTALNYAITGKVNNSQTRIFAEKFMSTTDECHNRANAYQVLAQNVLQAAQYGKFDLNEFYIEHCKFLGTILQDPIHQNNNPIDLRYLSKLANYGDAHALKTLFRLKRNERFGLFDFKQLPIIEALKGSNTSEEVVRFLHDQGYSLVPDSALRNYFPNSTNWNALNYTILGKGDRTILELVTQKIQFKQRKIGITFPELRGDHNETLMYLAAQVNKVDIAKFLLEKKVDLKVVDRDGYSPLHIAARYGNLEMVKFLIANLANVTAHAQTKTQNTTHAQTPIIEAIFNNGTVDVIQYLINNGSAVIKDPAQMMLTSAQLNKAHIAIFFCEQFVVLTKGRICMSVKLSESKLNALDYAAMHNNMLLADYLLSQNNGTGKIDARAINCAVEYEGQLQMIEYLHSMGAPIIDDHESLIARAIVNRKFEVAKFLIDSGADIEKVDKSKRTPLHEAVMADQRDLIRMLIEKGACADCAKDSNGKTPLDYIFEYKKQEALQYFLFHYPNNENSLMRMRTLKNDFASVQWLVERGGDVNILDNLKNTPLHLAAAKGYLQVARELVRSKCVNISIRNENNQTALDLAEANNHEDIVQLLKHHNRMRRHVENEPVSMRNSMPAYHNGASTRHSSFLINSACVIGHIVSHAFERISAHASKLRSFAFGITNSNDIPSPHGITNVQGIHNPNGITSIIDLNSTILLLDVLIRRYYSGERYNMQHSQVKPFVEARACALAFIDRLQEELSRLSLKNKHFDWFEFYRTVERFMISEQYGEIERLLRMTVRKFTDKQLDDEIEVTRMIDRVLIETLFTSEPENIDKTQLMISNAISHNAKVDPVHSKHELEVNKIGKSFI